MRARKCIGAGAILVVTALAMVLGPAAATAKPPSARTKAEYQKRRIKMLVEAGKTHIEVGIWCRDNGLVPQATAQFIRADEAAEGQLLWAKNILALMRRLDDRFWKFERKKPGERNLSSYDKKAKRAELETQKDRLKLANWAQKKGLTEEAWTEYQGVVAYTKESIQLDDKGRVVVEAGVLPEEISKRLQDEAVKINDKLYVRDRFLQKAPKIESVWEVENERLRVRSENSQEEAETLLAMCTALLPHLEGDMGGRPTRKLDMFVFKTRESYETYCKNADLGSHASAAGLADGASFVTLVCAENLPADTVQGIALHELTHLFQYGVTRAIMPSWYNEGLAETYGGEGTFSWDGKTLEAGKAMDSPHLAALKTDAGYIPLKTLLQSDALTLINENREQARHFYDESWAFLTYMRHHAGKKLQERFGHWELKCMAGALGAEAGKQNSRNFEPANQLFLSDFGPDLEAIEAGFRAWLEAQ